MKTKAGLARVASGLLCDADSEYAAYLADGSLDSQLEPEMPERIGHSHPFNQASNLNCTRGSATTALVHPGQTRPEPAKPLALPAYDGVRLDIHQGSAPASPQDGEPDPEQPVQGS